MMLAWRICGRGQAAVGLVRGGGGGTLSKVAGENHKLRHEGRRRAQTTGWLGRGCRSRERPDRSCARSATGGPESRSAEVEAWRSVCTRVPRAAWHDSQRGPAPAPSFGPRTEEHIHHICVAVLHA
jgi:hypothetical protein